MGRRIVAGRHFDLPVLVSMPSVNERKATCLSLSEFTMASRCDSDRPRRSSFQTTSTSPSRMNSSACARPVRSPLRTGGLILKQMSNVDAGGKQRIAL